MTEVFFTDGQQAAADAAADVLQRLAPQAAEVCVPFVRRLFAALADGHSFIVLEEDEVHRLQQAAPLAGTADAPLIVRGRRLFLGRIWQLEHDVAAHIRRLASAPLPPPDSVLSARLLAEWFGQPGSEGQQRAAALALLKPFMLICGGPGTGKTTTVAKLLGLLCSQSADLPRIMLAAPTGKAAAHMARALHRALDGLALPDAVHAHLLALEGRTIHRLLKLRPPQMQPYYHERLPLPADILIVDEASMIDLPLFGQLLAAVADGCRLIILGDENQLPSVGVGAVLAELAQPTVLDGRTAAELAALLPQHGFQTASDVPPLAANIARLTFSHRFGEHSGLGCLARAVAAGDASLAWAQFERFPAELGLPAGNAGQQAAELYRLHADYWQAVDAGDAAAAFRHQTDAVVLAARREEAEGFNLAYRRHLQQAGRLKAGAPWFAGQMIMVERNDYGLNVFNGDIGIVLADETGGLSACFPGADGIRRVALSRLGSVADAFALTVHKSQGSEYREVWLLPPETGAEGELFGRALLYTAITRARERFSFWGTQAAFAAAVGRNRPRRSALRSRLAGYTQEQP